MKRWSRLLLPVAVSFLIVGLPPQASGKDIAADIIAEIGRSQAGAVLGQIFLWVFLGIIGGIALVLVLLLPVVFFRVAEYIRRRKPAGESSSLRGVH